MKPWNDQELTHAIIGSSIEIHRALGPGLLEAVYEECLAREFQVRLIPFERQKPIPLVYRDLKLECGYRLDFIVANRVVVEVKAVEVLPAVIEPIMLTYLRLSGCRVGLVVNFHSAVLKDGIRRFVWHYQPSNAKDDAEAQRRQSEAETSTSDAAGPT